MAERRRLYARIDAEVSDSLDAIADDLRGWLDARRATGQVGPGPTSTIVSTEPLEERRRGRKRWNSAYKANKSQGGEDDDD